MTFDELQTAPLHSPTVGDNYQQIKSHFDITWFYRDSAIQSPHSTKLHYNIRICSL